jgi:photosystem II stability/assembly factor-like uncharacterized protein
MSISRKMFLGGLLIVAFLIPILAWAQTGEWEEIRKSPGVNLTDICILPDGQHGWSLGGMGYGGLQVTALYRTTNGGTSWEFLNFPGTESSIMKGVSFVSPNLGWIVGSSGAIYATTDGGDNWNIQNSGTSRSLAKVLFIDSLTGWAAGGWNDGSSYLLLKTTDGGNSWQNLSFGNDAYSCEGMHFYDSLNGWVCGRDNTLAPQIHRTTDGGDTWVRQTVPNLGTNVGVKDIDFPTADLGWATTSSLSANPLGAILHTIDGGENWTVQGYTGAYYNDALDCRDSLNIAIVSVQMFTSYVEKVLVSSDGGETWTENVVPIVDYTYGIQYVGDDIWICSNYSQILKSSDNGATWNWQHRSPLWQSVNWSDETNGWLVSGSHIATECYCLRTTDGGENWFPDYSAPGGAQVFFLDSDTGWMLWEGDPSYIWRTTDGGENWSQHNIASGPWIGGIHFVTANIGWAFGSGGAIRHTNNGGISWGNQNIHFINDQEGWSAGGYGGGNGFIHYTVNGGTTWNPQIPATNNHIFDISFINDLEGWAACAGGTVQKTIDGGLTWFSVGQVYHDYAEKILFIDSLHGWLVARNAASSTGDGRGFIYKTEDGGDTWVLDWYDNWVKSSISDITIQSDTILWACGYHDILLKYNMVPMGTVEGIVQDATTSEPVSGAIITIGGAETETNADGEYSIDLVPGNYTLTCQHDDYEPFTYPEDVTIISNEITIIDISLEPLSGVNDLSLPVFRLFDNYPNPFNPSTTISFSIAENTESMELMIYNIKGQKVKTYSFPNGGLGTRSVVWNGTDENNQPVSSGIYFYQLNAGKEFSETKRMLLLK